VFTGRVVKRGEPQWLPEDTDLALEWQAEKRSLCPGCRQPLDETTNADNDRQAYVAEDVLCQACQVIQWRRESLTDDNPGGAAARHIWAHRNETGGES
jgi:hypothetical protein